jgi:predicted ribosomally synthesized peptide with nif11-like leader
MSEEQLKAFMAAIQADAGLLQKLLGATEPGDVAAIAKEAGFSISAEEIKKAQSEYKGTELKLTDEWLDRSERWVETRNDWCGTGDLYVVGCA